MSLVAVLVMAVFNGLNVRGRVCHDSRAEVSSYCKEARAWRLDQSVDIHHVLACIPPPSAPFVSLAEAKPM